jgi:hypothetical protein
MNESVTIHGVQYQADHPSVPENRSSRIAQYQKTGYGLSEVDGRSIADELPVGKERAAVEEWADTVLADEMAKPYKDRRAMYFDYSVPFPHTVMGNVLKKSQ